MKRRELNKLGINRGPALHVALRLIGEAAASGLSSGQIRDAVRAVVADPVDHHNHPWFAELARTLSGDPAIATRSNPVYEERQHPAPWRQWGEGLEHEAVAQMERASRLPIAVSGALMPDAHLGYGLPIGGVLATDAAVIPYAVGVDIACRMRLTVLDMPARELVGSKQRLIRVLEDHTAFGLGAEFRKPKEHAVVEEDWGQCEITRRTQTKARRLELRLRKPLRRVRNPEPRRTRART